ncbi:MAG: valine--tRNA ligase [Phycisphaerales bacterium]|nr:valine--tRNA ligase [Phycisphaerales bacterium]
MAATSNGTSGGPNPKPTTGDPATAPASKAYQPANVEPRMLAKWDAAGAFTAHPERVLSGEARPYCILIPPPNVTGALHLGHALNNTLQDILTRAHRMMGFEALWMPGTDHAGIATQAVVERRLLKEQGKKRKDYTREQFVALVQEWKDEYEKRITNQLKAMGCSCDFTRQRFTMDDICARAVREAFFRLFKDGLIYRGKRIVNWDPVLQTAVADDECYDEDVDSFFYYLRYPLVHAMQGPLGTPTLRVGSEKRHSESGGTQGGTQVQPVTWNELASRGYPGADQHPGEQQAWVTVATTRPETYLGDTAVALNPKDPRAKALRCVFVELPIVGRVIPIIEDDYVVLPAAMWDDQEAAKSDPKAQFATGFLKVTPAHDPNDYDLGVKHKLPMINVMAPDGSISDKHGWSDPAETRSAHVFLGKTREEARKLVIAEFKSRNVGDSSGGGGSAGGPAGVHLFEGQKPYRHSVKHSDRSKAIIEPYLSDQWFVKVTDDRLAGSANRALVDEQRTGIKASGDQGTKADSAGDGSLRFYPSRYAKMYEQWHDGIRDWCISRQLWWGHRIPCFYIQISESGRIEAGNPTQIENLVQQNQRHILTELRRESELNGTAQDIWIDERIHAGRFPATVSFPGVSAGKFMIACCKTQQSADFLIRFGKGTGNSTYACDSRLLGIWQDDDVLDTWFSSALWPLSTLGWPDPAQSPQTKGLLEAFNPTSVLSTAREIITLWVSRMVMMNRYLLSGGTLVPSVSSLDNPTTQDRSARDERTTQGNGPVPFRDVFIHAVVQDGDGKRMSKSAGNGVDPLDIIDSHGADAMRFTLAQMTTNTQDVRMPVKPDPKSGKNTSEKFDAGRSFCNKLWNASTGVAIARLSKEPVNIGSSIPANRTLVDRWMLSRLARATAACESCLKNYEFADYVQTLYQLLWWDFCDWYLEAIKPTVDASPEQRAVLRAALDVILRLLHPVIPFVTEAIFEQLAKLPTGSVAGVTLSSIRGDILCTAAWPKLDASLIDEAAEREFERVRELVNTVRNVRSEHQVPPKRRVTLHVSPAIAASLSTSRGLIETLAGIEAIVATPPTHGSPAVAFRAIGEELHLSNLADAIDAGAEKDRLTKQLEQLRKNAGAISGRLNNPGYVDKAPPKLVEESKAQLAKINDEIAAIEGKLGALR